MDLPLTVRGCLFDLDGVLTDTAAVHEKSWKATFDEFLLTYATRHGGPFRAFSQDDYDRFVDGKPRADGIRSFLASRGIAIPDFPMDALGTDGAFSVADLGDRKNQLFLTQVASGGVEVFDGSIRFVEAVREQGLVTAVVSSSANAALVLDAAGIGGLFDAVVDGVTARQLGLAGKPAPDTFRAGAKAVGVAPAEAAVFEDALAGVEAGRSGSFGWVVGVNRVGHADALVRHGADVVVDDLSELLVPR